MKLYQFFLFLMLFLCSKLCYAEDLKAHRNVYTPKISALEAINIVKKDLPNFNVGEVNISKGKSGIKSLDIIITNYGKKITKIRLNPQTGDVLPKGYRTYYPEILISEQQGIKKVEKILPVLKVGNPWLGIDKKWKVPLILDGTVISEVLVDADSGKIIGK